MEDTDTKITVSSINEITAFNQERVITIRGDSVHNMTRAEAEISSKLRAAYEGDVMAVSIFPTSFFSFVMTADFWKICL